MEPFPDFQSLVEDWITLTRKSDKMYLLLRAWDVYRLHIQILIIWISFYISMSFLRVESTFELLANMQWDGNTWCRWNGKLWEVQEKATVFIQKAHFQPIIAHSCMKALPDVRWWGKVTFPHYGQQWPLVDIWKHTFVDVSYFQLYKSIGIIGVNAHNIAELSI